MELCAPQALQRLPQQGNAGDLTSGSRLAEMDSVARQKPLGWCGEGGIKVSGGQCCSLWKRSLCQQQGEAQGACGCRGDKRAPWRSLDRDKNLTEAVLGRGSLSESVHYWVNSHVGEKERALLSSMPKV